MKSDDWLDELLELPIFAAAKKEMKIIELAEQFDKLLMNRMKKKALFQDSIEGNSWAMRLTLGSDLIRALKEVDPYGYNLLCELALAHGVPSTVLV